MQRKTLSELTSNQGFISVIDAAEPLPVGGPDGSSNGQRDEKRGREGAFTSEKPEDNRPLDWLKTETSFLV